MEEDIKSPALPTDNKATTVEGREWICPEFKVSGIFSSHMVLQRDEEIKVWGFSKSVGSRVSGCFMNETVSTCVDQNNRWILTFSSHPYSHNGENMVIVDNQGHKVIFEDILIGDVWMIGGQSNAELNLAPCMTMTPDLKFDEDDNFRIFAQTQAYVYENQHFCATPQPDIINPEWCWKRPSREASLAFSAMGWHFASTIEKQIDIPLGMVMMCAGGACLTELYPVEVAHKQGYNNGGMVAISGYYNTLINPLIPLAFRGMLFFQGESEGCNRENSEKYNIDLIALIKDERERFGINFPLYNVQLSDYREEGANFFRFHDIVRVRQFEALSQIENSSLTVDMDLGAPKDAPDWAHSPLKKELGERLANLVLAKEYGVFSADKAESPKPISAILDAENGKITVKFKDVYNGLKIRGYSQSESKNMQIKGFSIGDYDNRTPVCAIIKDNDTVIVDIPKDIDIMSVNYVGYAYFLPLTPEDINLLGGNDLPSCAFNIPVIKKDL